MSLEETEFAASSNNRLARFILSSRWIRSSDQTIKSDAFMPHPESLDVSVTRHEGLSEQQIWTVGEAIATQQQPQKTLYGRTDLESATVRGQSLEVSKDPVPGNPNHANILGWPKEKPAQKIIALELAAASAYWCYAPKAP